MENFRLRQIDIYSVGINNYRSRAINTEAIPIEIVFVFLELLLNYGISKAVNLFEIWFLDFDKISLNFQTLKPSYEINNPPYFWFEAISIFIRIPRSGEFPNLKNFLSSGIYLPFIVEHPVCVQNFSYTYTTSAMARCWYPANVSRRHRAICVVASVVGRRVYYIDGINSKAARSFIENIQFFFSNYIPYIFL